MHSQPFRLYSNIAKVAEIPSKFTSDSPPELLDMTGTPQAIASNAAKPKLSV
jgi:hypothetical protein